MAIFDPGDLPDLELANVAAGAAPLAFRRELAEVLANIADETTDAVAPRTITLVVRFLPSTDRQTIGIEVGCKSKLVASMSAAGTAVFGKQNGQLKAWAADFAQPELFDEPVTTLSVADRRAGER